VTIVNITINEISLLIIVTVAFRMVLVLEPLVRGRDILNNPFNASFFRPLFASLAIIVGKTTNIFNS
jgi:hypothetical protein